MSIPEIVSAIIAQKSRIGGLRSVVFVACGGSFSTLYPAKYLLDTTSKTLRVGHYTANEFVHATPSYVNENSVVVTISHHGNTPETVASARKAQEIGAASIVFTFEAGSPLTEHGDHVHLYEWGPEANQGNSNVVLVMQLAAEILNQVEGYPRHAAFMQACGSIDTLIREARSRTLLGAERFAARYKDAPVIYVLGSGTGFSAAYSFSVCILMEMQWINSAFIHSGEFFHGPFEITDPEVPFILLAGSGRTRPLDDRVLSFLERYGGNHVVIDSRLLGLGTLDMDVAELFDHIFFTAVLRQYAEKLAEARNHPLSHRRYMWKVEY